MADIFSAAGPVGSNISDYTSLPGGSPSVQTGFNPLQTLGSIGTSYGNMQDLLNPPGQQQQQQPMQFMPMMQPRQPVQLQQQDLMTFLNMLGGR